MARRASNTLEGQVIEALACWIQTSGLTPQEVAVTLDIPGAHVYGFLKRKRYGITAARLLQLWNRIGGTWKLKLTPPRRKPKIARRRTRR